MKHVILTLLALGLGLATTSHIQAATGDVTYDLTGTLSGKANLTCKGKPPGTTRVKVTSLPTIIPVPSWKASLTLLATGNFSYWEIDSKSANAAKPPSTANGWTNYTGAWTQTGSNLSLKLDATSLANDFKYFNGGTSPTSSLLYFDVQNALWTGVFAGGTVNGSATLPLKLSETTELKITNYYTSSPKAFPKTSCSTTWRYNKQLTTQ